MSINNKKAFVTGATGFLGMHLCSQLVEQGWHVFALCRSVEKAAQLSPKITVVEGDILKPNVWQKRLPDSLNAIFHTAASTNTWFKNNSMQRDTNLNGTKNMLRIASNYPNIRFVHISSVVVFGMHSVCKNLTEDMPKLGLDSPINYIKTKTESEKMVLGFQNLDTVVINPTHIIGPGDKHNWARLINMVAHRTLPSIPNGSGSFVDVRDVAQGIILAYHRGIKGENYLLGGTDLNFKQFVHKVAKLLKVEVTNRQLPNALLMALAHLKNTISRLTNKEPDITPESVTIISDLYGCDSAKAKSQLNYTNRDLNQTLKDTVEFLRAQKLI